MAIRQVAGHYTPEGKLHKGNGSSANRLESEGSDASEKRI
jgi:hypothetical protein